MLVFEITPEGQEYFQTLDHVGIRRKIVPDQETLRYSLLDFLSREYLLLDDPQDAFEERIIGGLNQLRSEGYVVQRDYFTVDRLVPVSEDWGKYN